MPGDQTHENGPSSPPPPTEAEGSIDRPAGSSSGDPMHASRPLERPTARGHTGGPSYEALLPETVKAKLTEEGIGPEALNLLEEVNRGGAIPPGRESEADKLYEKMQKLPEGLQKALAEAESEILRQRRALEGTAGAATKNEADLLPKPPAFEEFSLEDRMRLESQGITKDVYDRFQMLSGQIAQGEQLTEAQAKEFFEIYEQINVLEPDIKEKMAQMHQQANAGLNKPRSDTEQPDPEGDQLISEAQSAVDEAIASAKNGTLDIDAAQEAAAKLSEARKHADEHEAAHIEKGSSWQYHLLVALGVAFFLYVGAQYAMANAVQSAAGGGK